VFSPICLRAATMGLSAAVFPAPAAAIATANLPDDPSAADHVELLLAGVAYRTVGRCRGSRAREVSCGNRAGPVGGQFLG
jgi:hypothetical protein